MNGVEKGRYGEDLAAAYLLKEGYRICERNWRRKTGEIDLIAEKKGVLVFVEVKSRSSPRFGSGAEAVTRKKQLKIIQTAQLYLCLCGNNAANRECRFDVIEIFLQGQAEQRIHHIIGAFGH